MGDVGTGVKNFKRGMLEEDEVASPVPPLSKPTSVDSSVKSDRMAG